MNKNETFLGVKELKELSLRSSFGQELRQMLCFLALLMEFQDYSSNVITT